MDNFDFKKYLAEGKLLKEEEGFNGNKSNKLPKDLSVKVVGDSLSVLWNGRDIITSPIDNEGNVSFSEVYSKDDLEENGYPEGFNDSNWKDILGKNHHFVEIINNIGGDVEALDNRITIIVNASSLKAGSVGEKVYGTDLENDILHFWNTLQDDASESNDEYEAEWDTVFFIEEYPEYEGMENQINQIIKKHI
tara:strand:- start:77 stop:655 length:579 start_codon:yes stop_codon:yes gene_type:complete